MTPTEYARQVEALDLDRLIERQAMKRKARQIALKIGAVAATIGILAGVKANAAEYPGLLKVTEVQPEYLTGVDGNGTLWDYDTDPEDWQVGDLAAVIFEDNGTESIYDDDIRQIRYVGYMELYR